ncbi:PTS glucose transporter subunit IIA [Kluyvera georgiana]|nr:PTS glucose transporter subunit IIA [Kluyvera georgiana]
MKNVNGDISSRKIIGDGVAIIPSQGCCMRLRTGRWPTCL